MKRVWSILATAVLLCCSAVGLTAFATDANGVGLLAASGLSVTGDTLYITDGYTNQIYSYDGTTLVLVAGNENLVDGIPAGGYLDGVAEYTLFDEPYTAVSWNGGVIVSDTKNHALRFIQDGVVKTYAGNGTAGYTDGDVAQSSFYLPSGLAVDTEGSLYVADTGNGVIRKVTTAGVVSTYATNFSAPSGLYWYEGILYVTDVETNQILSVQDGMVSVVAGQAISQEEEWIAGYQDGTTQEAMFSLPQAVYVDEMGIYIGDVGNNVVRKIADGEVTTLYSPEELADPTALVKYQGELLIGDLFVKKTLSYADTSNTVLSAEPVQTATSVEDSTLEIQEQEALGTVFGSVSSLWGVLLLLIVLVMVVSGIMLYRRYKQEEGVE